MSERAAKPAEVDGKPAVDRRQFLSYMQPRLIMDLKTEALEQGRPAYELVEDAVKAYLEACKG